MDHVHAAGLGLGLGLQRSNSTTTTTPPAADNEPTSETTALAPVHLAEDFLQKLSVWQLYLVSEAAIKPMDSSWRSSAARDPAQFVTDAAMYVFIRYHNSRKTLS